ncbi:putative SP-containing membrane protein [Vairimorpha necatrix]|uniref:SP-containing membrane protein n=1 Tax=Vairimorpha necatrix TaxID=6039 RepID=A0AAX4JCF9_9MICR
MKWLKLILSIICIQQIIKTEESYKEIIFNKIFINVKKCDTIEKRINENNLSLEHIKFFFEIVWNTITNHEIFKRIVQDDTSENSFLKRKDLLREDFFQSLHNKERNLRLLNTLTNSEKMFCSHLYICAREYYDMFINCYKDTLIESNSLVQTLEHIIKKNTCFIRNGINENLPKVVFKMCRGLVKYYNECYGEFINEHLNNELKNNQLQLTKAICPKDALNMNITEVFSNGIVNTNITDVLEIVDTNYGKINVFLYTAFLIFVCCILISSIAFIIFSWSKKNENNQSDEIELISTNPESIIM